MQKQKALWPLHTILTPVFRLNLILKSVVIAKGKDFDANHRLNDLCVDAGIKLTKDQACTLELLSKSLSGGVATQHQKKKGKWDNYHDVILEKHIVQESEGDIAHKDRFPTLENYLKIWGLCEERYRSTLI